MEITHASLFSGIGAADIAAHELGIKNVFNVEINPFCRKVLDYWFPESIGYEDIRTTDFTKFKGRITILSGGFPCQPFSAAGKRRGTEDDRYLWPEMLRAIHEIQPAYILGENVFGILSMVESNNEIKVASETSLFGEDNEIYERRGRFVTELIRKDFEREGYALQLFCIPACAVGAPHRRDRIWFVAKRVTPDSTREGGVSFAIDAHTDGDRDTPREEGERVEGGGGNIVLQQGERGYPSQWLDGLPALSRNAANSQCGRCDDGDGDRGEGRDNNDFFGKFTEKDTDNGFFVRAGETGHAVADTEGVGRNVLRASDGREIHNTPVRDKIRSVNNGHGEEQSAPDPKMQRAGRVRDEGEEKGAQSGDELLGECHRLHDELPAERFRDFPSTFPVICGGDDGVRPVVDALAVPFDQWRSESVKAYGNSMVVPVVHEIFRAILMDIEHEKRQAMF